MPPKSAAARRVFSTTKLLEQILLQLPIRSLSSSKQVCRRWKATVKGSLSAQKKLFLKPSYYHEFQPHGYFYVALTTSLPDSTRGPMFIMNPMFVKYSKDLRGLSQSRRGPWQNTLITQPAMTELTIAITVKKTLHRQVRNAEGLTIKDVADWVRVFLEHMKMKDHSVKHLYLPYHEALLG